MNYVEGMHWDRRHFWLVSPCKMVSKHCTYKDRINFDWKITFNGCCLRPFLLMYLEIALNQKIQLVIDLFEASRDNFEHVVADGFELGQLLQLRLHDGASFSVILLPCD